MTIPLRTLLRYWRSALLDSARHIDTESVALYPCDRGTLAAGRLPPDVLELVWRDAEEGLSLEERKDLKSIDVLIALQVLEPAYEHSAAYSTMKQARVPLWLCVNADRECEPKMIWV